MMSLVSEWRAYENEIYELLVRKAEPGASVEFDAKRPGRLSGVDRQIDVWLEGSLAGGVLPGPTTLAVDCKCWTTTVNVPDVERFLGMLEDVGADIGLLVTTTGFSKAADRRASGARGLELEVITFAQLETWRPNVEWCSVCSDPESDSMPGMFYAQHLADVPDGRVMVGSCDRCQAIHVRCSCGTWNSVVEGDEDKTLGCEGCGRAFKVDSLELDSSAIPVNDDVQARVHLLDDGPT